MAITSPVYCGRDDVLLALEAKSTVRENARIDRAVMSAARTIEGLLHRRFYPEDATRYFDWPNFAYAYPWRLWFRQYDLVSATEVTSGGVAIPIGEVFFEPANKESWEPFTYLELDRSSSASFGGGSTPQRDIAVTGTWGYSAITTAAGALVASIGLSDTSAACSNGSQVTAGTLLLAGSERILVTDNSMTDTSRTITADLANQNNAVSVTVSGGTFFQGETLLVDSERMFVTDVAGSTLTVTRGFAGSVLASHASGAEVYALRGLTIQRGVLGTAATLHSGGDQLARFVYPGPVAELAVALSIDGALQESSGYSRTVGAGDNLRNASGAALESLAAQVAMTYGRKSRSAVI